MELHSNISGIIRGSKMKTRIYSEKIIQHLLVIFLVLSVVFACTAQTKNISREMSQKLKEKVLLNDSQTKSIENILKEYITARRAIKSQAEINEIKDNVNSLLDKKQKIKFEVIKNSWWQEIDESIAEGKSN